jgi:hypothetical protein
MNFMPVFCRAWALLAWCVVLTFLVPGCRSKSNELRLESKNFEEQVEPEQNLVFTFDKELVPKAVLQKWDTVPYLTFTPAVKGRFKWTAPNELAFSPHQPFAPSTDFQAELTDLLLKHSPKKYTLSAGSTIRFHTPYLNMAEAQAFWGRSSGSPDQLEARLKLAFNYPVTFLNLRDYLQVFQGTTNIPFELATGSPEYISGRL